MFQDEFLAEARAHHIRQAKRYNRMVALRRAAHSIFALIIALACMVVMVGAGMTAQWLIDTGHWITGYAGYILFFISIGGMMLATWAALDEFLPEGDTRRLFRRNKSS